MKNIKDYLHFYLGCDCQVTTGYGVQGPPQTFIASFHGIYYDRWTTDGMELSIQVITEHGGRWIYREDQVKLALRPLSDMTEEEQNDVWHMDEPMSVLKMEGRMTRNVVLCPERIKYLLSRGFDLFNLIPEGLAIDATTLKEKAV